ncbi:Variant surface glycoprotein [Trypanosoma congolense IL3000]|uniref:Variant surface glycoprotein n=1 Tax=Trypanosoma congolense (strain IL3000) TaxID=1068625 RepID=F9WBT2_TRYCI|nr:Variant surface glycoprotein [Trypanosoma congolense IL3000]
MCRRLPLFFFFGGVCGTDGTNKDAFDKLCAIVENMSALMEKHSVAKSSLEQALYGEDRMASFDKDGSVSTVHGCGFGSLGRSEYCSHMQGGGLTRNGNSCFSHSLLGTFLCLCTKGRTGDKDLCGLNNAGGGAGWTSWSGYEQGLFQKVWTKIKQKCIENNKTSAGTSVDLGSLENALNEIKQNTKPPNGKAGYVTLGGVTNTDGICGGARPGDACVTYTWPGNAANIPLAEKILEGINKTRTQRQTSSKDSTQTSDFLHQDDHGEASDNGPDGEQEGEGEEEEESAPNPDPQEPSKPSRPRRKRSTKKPTEQPVEPLRAILHDDGSFLPQPFWLLSAFVI